MLNVEIKQYIDDVEKNFPVELNFVIGAWANSTEVRTTVNELNVYKKIEGLILVGNVPMHKFYIHDMDCPNPLFYEDCELPFLDLGNKGIATNYKGVPEMKMWVANIRATEGEDDEGIDDLQRFFKKTHAYYDGEEGHIENRALAISGSDWINSAYYWKNNGDDLMLSRITNQKDYIGKAYFLAKNNPKLTSIKNIRMAPLFLV